MQPPRIILFSGSLSAYFMQQRTILLWLGDAADDFVEVAVQAPSELAPTLTVADVTDAFHLVPVHADDIRHQTVCFRGKYQAFKVLVFGSKVAPTLRARVAALLCRSADTSTPDFHKNRDVC
eukprot:6205802-Amphidinium_carterae.2